MSTQQPKPKMVGEPLHEVCKINVDTPRLIYQQKNGIDVWLQWYGESEHFDLSGKQFLFPVNVLVEEFSLEPESFAVIMVGPAKNWPTTNPTILAAIIERCDGENVTVVYAICPLRRLGVYDGNSKEIPATAMIPLTILLADDGCGLITPKPFFDDNVRLTAIRKFERDL